MKDFIGNELNIGDEIVFVEPKDRDLKLGKIISITGKILIIEHEGKRYPRRDITNQSFATPKDRTKQTPSQVVKIQTGNKEMQ